MSFSSNFVNILLTLISRHCLTIINVLFKIKKSAIRIINCASFYSHSSPLFKLSNILKLYDLYVYHIGIRMFKAVNCEVDVNLYNNLVTHSQSHQHITRNRKKLILPFFRKSRSQSCVAYVGPKVWNLLSDPIIECTSLRTFKASLKVSLIETY